MGKLILCVFMLILTEMIYAASKTDITIKISKTATAAGLDPDLVLAIATIESGLNPNAVGSLNEQGLFQLRPEYHRTIPGNSSHNILVGVAYLLELKLKLQPRYGNAWFVGFNYGPNKLLKFPRETPYYKKVMFELNRIKFKRYLAAI